MEAVYIPCPHEELIWNPNTGNSSCKFCGEAVEAPELTEPLREAQEARS